MIPLNRKDVLLLISGSALLSALSFCGLSLLIPNLLNPARATAMARDLVRQAWVIRGMHEGPMARVNPNEQPLRIWPGATPPPSSRAEGGAEQRLLQRELELHNIHGPLRCQPLEPLEFYCGYWLLIGSVEHGPVWVYSSPARAMPALWPLIRTASLLLGCGINLALFLHLRVQRPIKAILAHLPSIPTDQLELVPEGGIDALKTLGIRINRCLSSLNEVQESRRRLLQGLAHDIGSPLSRLSIRLEDLESDSDATPQQVTSALPQLRGDINRLITLTRQLQQAAGIDQPPYRSQMIAVDELCARLLSSYPQVEIRNQVPRLLARLDPGLVERALSNLIDNAVRHGLPPIRLRARLQSNCLVLMVEDSGRGLTASQLVMPRIAPAHDRQQQQRYGLGLTIVERCCQLHGGKLVLKQSALGGLQAELHLPQPA